MNSPVNWRKWLVLSLVGLTLSVCPIGCDYDSIPQQFGAEAVAQCNKKCPFQNRTGDIHFDLNCGADCSIQQCQLGCSLWKDGSTSCQKICNATSDMVVSRELYCVMGCNEALNMYYQMLKDYIGTPPAPALVADSLTPTSLSLFWEPPSLINLTYMLQWCYEDLPGTWQFNSNDSRIDGSIIHVWNLKPYTKYRFLVALVSVEGTLVCQSVESVPICTSGSGRPLSAPAVTAWTPAPRVLSVAWTAGPAPNGPLLSYVLSIRDSSRAYQAVKDIPASNNTLFYMFQNLQPSHEYIVSVAMRNAIGEGPPAYVTVTTPPLPSSTPEQPILILGGEHTVLAAPANDMLFEQQELYITEHNITGVALDISKDYLFISVSNGYVYRSSLSKKGKPVPILTPEEISFKPLDLSVDWLNHHLYVLGEVFYSKPGNAGEAIVYSNWEIMRCDFEGNNHLVALSGSNARPLHFEVDPYNGYIFWCISGAGLYRAEMGVKCEDNVMCHGEYLLRDTHLATFTIDPADFHLLVPHLTRNNILAVSLDGREVVDFRSNTQKPMFKSARSIAYANGLFYWTNGKEMLSEEYHAQNDRYFHNEYPLVYNNSETVIKEVSVNLRSCQPVPIPVNPPISVQSIMGVDLAKVSWQPPHLLGHQGKGAWQDWKYRLQIIDTERQDSIYVDNINGTSYVVYNLKPNTEYMIKAAAFTSSGAGPWSSEFTGKTLPSSLSTRKSLLIWSGPDGLFQTNLTGDNMRILIQRSELKQVYITDMSWYKDLLYLVTNASKVMWYNMTNREHGFVPYMNNVGGLAVDWVGKRLYWSNPKQQLITRGSFDGSNREPVPIVTVARQLTIDSLEAYIYWNTGHAVEAARLNGENKMVYYPAQLFSGKQVMGIATDLQNKWLYWLVRDYDGTELHRAPTADKLTHGYEISMRSTMLGRVGGGWSTCVSVWAGRATRAGRGRAALTDLTAGNQVDLPYRAYALKHMDVDREGPDTLVAIPESINPASILISGSWDHFNVSWAPAQSVNVYNARVLYDISLRFKNNLTIERTVSQPWTSIKGAEIVAYSSVELIVRGHTYWGHGPVSLVRRRTPQYVPTAPYMLRLYTHMSITNVRTLEVRWRSPLEWRGAAGGYEVTTWTRDSKPQVIGTSLQPYVNRILYTDHTNATVYFKVRAFTAAGFGNYSETISISPTDINPVPRVMISSQESFKVVDLDSANTETVPKSTGIPLDFGLSIQENVVYWVNDLEEIFASRVDGSSHYKLTSINNTATSSCIDWVSRSVYWSQSDPDGVYVTYRADIASYNSKPKIQRLFETKKPPVNMQIVPLERSLLWYEESNHTGSGVLMKSNLDGTNIRSFFNKTNKHDNPDICNCPENPQVAKTYTIDMTKKQIEIYWLDPWTHNIVATDINSCKCRVVVSPSQKNYGFIPSSITVDSKYVYWFNTTERMVYFTNKHKKQKIEQAKTFDGYKLIALDIDTQPYPPIYCLFPERGNIKTTAILNSTNSITLLLPQVCKPQNCSNIKYELSITEYTLYYKKYESDNTECNRDTCTSIITTDNRIAINGLNSFTKYMVYVYATNYYSKYHGQTPLKIDSMILQTAAEAPSPPQNVSVEVLSPVLCRVSWKPEPGLLYELHWQTHDTVTQSLQFKEHNMVPVGRGAGRARMSRLSPDTPYEVWLRARRGSPDAAGHVDSPLRALRTPRHPTQPRVAGVTPYTVTLHWDPRTVHVYNFTIEWSEVGTPSETWHACERNRGTEWIARGLTPRTKYAFRLRLHYTPTAPPFYWPTDQRLVAETTSDVPLAPVGVWCSQVAGRVVRVRWSEPDCRGDRVDHYRLWGRPSTLSDDNELGNETETTWSTTKLPDDLDEHFREMVLREGLVLLYNCTETSWVTEWDVGREWWVRVQAHNGAGWGGLSVPASLVAPPPVSSVRGAVGAVAVGAVVAVIAVCGIAYKKRKIKKPDPGIFIPPTTVSRGPDIELAALRELPIRHSNNVIYNQGVITPSVAEIAALPRIRREQISLNKFLGAGAFGEVFQGVAKDILQSNTTTQVAVKTLRKGATEQEKAEFLQEAALMANFKHEHILRLFGVCLDNDPHYIIMELMEDGDLLTYLRTKRTTLYTCTCLSLLDLLNICVDVTRGCRYLEEMHFVHRDLAARNCLVAHVDQRRCVKIGDFGLARDVYRNDYYRKEGEGLLPVRWMAVESLIDGIFSAQSDVWSWAVLCWEVLSLGHQPYPGRTNRQVLGYVRNRGTPNRPPNCPDQMYELLRRCWSYNPDDRPTFKECLEIVTSLRDNTSPKVALTESPLVAPPHYITVLPDAHSCCRKMVKSCKQDLNINNPLTHKHYAVDNRTYLLDENENAWIDDDVPDLMEASHTLPELASIYAGSIPDYVCDGYEIPRTSFSSMRSCMSARHSVIGVAPNRLIKPTIYRSHSLRANMRPTATITPHRYGINKRASLSDNIRIDDMFECEPSTSLPTNDEHLVEP